MAQKYITLDDAADQLGVSKDRLLALRDSGEAHGYRDGASWKFKAEEIDRLQAAGITEDADAPGVLDSDEIELDTVDDLSGDDLSGDGDSILLSDLELGHSDAASPSTIIGGSGSSESSDLDLPSDSGLELDLELGGESSTGGDDLLLDDDVHGVESSDIHGAGTSDVLDIDVDTELGSQFENMEELDVDLEAQSSRIVSDEGAGPTAGESELSLDSVLGTGSGSGGSEIELIGDDDDGELVLGEGSGSDITLSSEDSGISLLGPSDSGLSLDDPDFTLGGSAVGSLDLGSEEAGGVAETTDDDFQLTPLDAAAEDADESGSQVIALDSEEDFDYSAATQLGAASFAQEATEEPAVAEALIEDDAPALLESEDLIEEAAPAPVAGSALAAAPGTAAAPGVTEARFGMGVVTSLAFAVMILGLTTVMMFDLVRNMWSWNEPYELTSPLMDLMDTIFG